MGAPTSISPGRTGPTPGLGPECARTSDGPVAKATALTVAVKDRTGALDTNLNGIGELINPNYGEAVLARVHSTDDGSNGGTAADLYIAPTGGR